MLTKTQSQVWVGDIMFSLNSTAHTHAHKISLFLSLSSYLKTVVPRRQTILAINITQWICKRPLEECRNLARLGVIEVTYSHSMHVGLLTFLYLLHES